MGPGKVVLRSVLNMTAISSGMATILKRLNQRTKPRKRRWFFVYADVDRATIVAAMISNVMVNIIGAGILRLPSSNHTI